MAADRQIRLWKSGVGTALLVLVPAAAWPQVAGNERVLPASATLPVSNEAMLLSSRAEDAVRRGDFRLAIEITEQIAQLPEQLVAMSGRLGRRIFLQRIRSAGGRLSGVSNVQV